MRRIPHNPTVLMSLPRNSSVGVIVVEDADSGLDSLQEEGGEKGRSEGGEKGRGEGGEQRVQSDEMQVQSVKSCVVRYS